MCAANGRCAPAKVPEAIPLSQKQTEADTLNLPQVHVTTPYPRYCRPVQVGEHMTNSSHLCDRS